MVKNLSIKMVKEMLLMSMVRSTSVEPQLHVKVIRLLFVWLDSKKVGML